MSLNHQGNFIDVYASVNNSALKWKIITKKQLTLTYLGVAVIIIVNMGNPGESRMLSEKPLQTNVFCSERTK